MDTMELKRRLNRIAAKIGQPEPPIVYQDADGREHRKPLINFVLDAIRSGKRGTIRAVDLDRSAAAMGNGVLYSIACLEDGFYTTDERGNVVIPTEKEIE